MRSVISLYDSLAPDYEREFSEVPYKRVYDLLAWEDICALLPPMPATIIDAGCGTGRWVDRLISLGHQVIGIEFAPAMIEQLKRKEYGRRFTLKEGDMEEVTVERESADAVIAIGSWQYTREPARMVKSFASWTKPGGVVMVLVDSFMALVLELLNTGRKEEALERLLTARGVWKQGGHEAELHLFDRQTLKAYFEEAGLVDVKCKGLLVTATAFGLGRCNEMILQNENELLRLERVLSEFEMMADASKQIIALGRKAVR